MTVYIVGIYNQKKINIYQRVHEQEQEQEQQEQEQVNY